MPAIQIAAAAPAFASSAVNDIINPIVDFSTSGQGGVNAVAQKMFVTNDGPRTLSADTIELTFTITGGPSGNNWASYELKDAQLWSFHASPGTGIGTRVLKFRYQGSVAKGTQALLGVVRATQASNGGTKSASLAYVGLP